MDHDAIGDVYASFLTMIPDPFIIIGEDGTYLEVIGGVERSLYDEPWLLKGRNIYDILDRTFADFFMEQVRYTLAHGQLHTFEYQLATETVKGIPKNGPGGKQWFEARLYPLKQGFKRLQAVSALLINITERKSIQQQLRELSYQDALTKVSNRRYFFEQLEIWLKSSNIATDPVSLIIMDVDHFKETNDRYGHLAGDYLLHQLAIKARQRFTHNELIARFGGDEFVIMFHAASDTAIEQAQSFRQYVESQQMPYEGVNLSMTISIGVATTTQYDDDPTNLVARADKALYWAKQMGRNLVRNG